MEKSIFKLERTDPETILNFIITATWEIQRKSKSNKSTSNKIGGKGTPNNFSKQLENWNISK